MTTNRAGDDRNAPEFARHGDCTTCGHDLHNHGLGPCENVTAGQPCPCRSFTSRIISDDQRQMLIGRRPLIPQETDAQPPRRADSAEERAILAGVRLQLMPYRTMLDSIVPKLPPRIQQRVRDLIAEIDLDFV